MLICDWKMSVPQVMQFGIILLIIVSSVAAQKANVSTSSDEFKLTILTTSSSDPFYAENTKPSDMRANFEEGWPIFVVVTATNISNKSASLARWDYFEPFIPKLEDSGGSIEYLKDKQSEVSKNPDDVPFKSSSVGEALLPNQTKAVGVVNLFEWYGPLKPGVYNLAIYYRARGGRQVRSNCIVFQVNARTPN